jgi:hypothetical protein
MADSSDVREALAALIGATLYPQGVPSGTNPASPAVGACCRIYGGWPERDKLDKDIRTGIVNVSVFPQQDGKNTTRFPMIDRVFEVDTATLSVAISGTTATIAGTIAVPQNVGLIIDDQAFIYAVQAGDTLDSIAAGLAALVSVSQPATASWSTVTIPGARHMVGRVGVSGMTGTNVGQTKQGFRITVWAPTPALRDLVGSTIEPMMRFAKRVPLQDGSIAHSAFVRSIDSDSAEKALIYRRDLITAVEYSTYLMTRSYEVVAPVMSTTVVSDFTTDAVISSPITIVS